MVLRLALHVRLRVRQVRLALGHERRRVPRRVHPRELRGVPRGLPDEGGRLVGRVAEAVEQLLGVDGEGVGAKGVGAEGLGRLLLLLLYRVSRLG